MPKWTNVRDIVLFFGGLMGVFHETVISTSNERPTLLLMFAAMMGLPAFLRTDEGPGPDPAPPHYGSEEQEGLP